jgi:hypothetical protein
MKKKWGIVLSCLAVVLLLMINNQHKWRIEPMQGRKVRFLYLVQTERCIPDRLKSDETIGNTTCCQCDVLVLSYKQACNETSPTHVKYISVNVPTSWSMGRNLLLEGAMKRSEKYLYYIFMDDDIDLQAKVQDNQTNPWRVFEDFLRRVEPAVGAVDMNQNQWVSHTFQARRAYGCGFDVMPEYMTVVKFDAAFNAFHYKAVEHILPYPSKYDNISWWFAAEYALVKSKILFPRQSVTLTGLLAVNLEHRPYPRTFPSTGQFLDIVSMVQADLPEGYQNSSLLSEWKMYGYVEVNKSRLITCLSSAPPKMHIGH